ncbi:YciI family protein [Undibacterium terreum]|uniref:YCII-related domain-containing protein n=1 Tax=Undibacterium terreum TaxID=1224302 RepID=A0A916V0C2_9BURK|nr:YciI family protein [Undibacterium terreum]GGC98044.1 hypothetical protein GCM10011396_51950 [Undibacterium terreum]
MYLLDLSYIKEKQQVEPENKAHLDWVKKYLADGSFLFAGAKRNGQGGILAVKSMEMQALTKILSEDSYVIANVGEYQITEVDIKLAQPTYEALKAA